ncbi:sensor histidine kinase [Marivita sp. S6314]|uniref:sensor histidine kinase n=1 Tax=Marivita sp. S6314 TaxID=2926406 RepID=UPI001FF265D8|nr:sensor histidine kinase [Marivita sp. S6314]MCK0148477.1 sensor histidine kinase [Marivita sp. S6314]
MSDPLRVSGSLRNRLALILIGGAAILALFLVLLVRSYAAQIAQQGQDQVLGASVTSILDTAIIQDGQVEVDFPYSALSMLSTPSDDRVFHAIYQDDTLLSGYASLTRDATRAPALPAYATAEIMGTAVRRASASRTLIGADQRTTITVIVAQTQDALSGTLNRISRTVAGFGIGFFLLATALALWASSSTIGQLQRLTQSVTKRGPQDLRPFDKPVPTEMVPLVSSLNTLMGRLDQSLNRSEDFIAEAAHRVRTPLATVRSHAEAMLQRVGREENRATVRSMMRAIDESSRAAGQLLDHAMITFRADHLERDTFDLVELVQDLVVRLTPVAELKDVTVRLDGPEPVVISGDAILVQNAVRNILDNALKYAPGDSLVLVRVTNTPTPQVVVVDEGQGFPHAQIDTLADRFTRGDNAAGTIGSGLGLTIAQDVAEAHGGILDLSNRPEGGACVTLSF